VRAPVDVSAAEPTARTEAGPLGGRGSARNERGRNRRNRTRRRLGVVVLVLAAVLSPAVYSYSSTMLRPSSLPLGVRSVEWLRGHCFAWLVDGVERLYYEWNAPKKGGPPLQTLPALAAARGTLAAPRRHRLRAAPAPYRPARIRPVVRPAIP